jgi:uncharacterized protein YndB with AHSA1/START domain
LRYRRAFPAGVQRCPSLPFSTTSSPWEGSPITWEGDWQGRPYRDHGVIERVDPPRQLVYTRFSPRSGLEDIPGNHHLVTITIDDAGTATQVSLTQDHNTTETERAETERNWEAMLAAVQRYLEA